MAEVEIPLTYETALRLRVAMLEHECTQLKARVLDAEATRLRDVASAVYQQAVETMLSGLHPAVPRPQGPIGLDLETCCLRYEVADAGGEAEGAANP